MSDKYKEVLALKNSDLLPEHSPLFVPWTEPDSGITSYLLKEHYTPFQQAFYFTNSNVTADGAYIWFYASYPPSPGQCLGVIDMVKGEVRIYPETRFVSESPWIDPVTGEVYWAIDANIYRRGPKAEDKPQLVGYLPKSTFGSSIRRITTHLTRSADGKSLNLDVIAGDTWHLSTMEIESGKLEVWQSFPVCYKHAQFSPVDSNMIMIAQDHWEDIKTGESFGYKNRIWLIRKGEMAQPLFKDDLGKNVHRHCHEWWAHDGKGIWFVDYDHGTEYYNLTTGEHVNVWPNGTCHSHSSTDDKFLTGDIGTYQWAESPVKVAFYNTLTRKEIAIVSHMPAPPEVTKRGFFHAHPHPQFVLNDTYIAYTTTVRGTLDYAMVPVADLIARTS
jgi:hypothetical protein